VDFTALVRAALPAEWSVQQSATGVLPAGWQSPDATATTLQVSDGHRTYSISLVSLDWVGLQTRGATIDTVRAGARAKVIIASGSLEGLSWLDTLAPRSASLACADGMTSAYA
jgi:hypothetical protein